MAACNESFLIGYAVGYIPRAVTAPHLRELAGSLFVIAPLVACESEKERDLLFRLARRILNQQHSALDSRAQWRTIRLFALVCADKYDAMGFNAGGIRHLVNEVEKAMNKEQTPAA